MDNANIDLDKSSQSAFKHKLKPITPNLSYCSPMVQNLQFIYTDIPNFFSINYFYNKGTKRYT